MAVSVLLVAGMATGMAAQPGTAMDVRSDAPGRIIDGGYYQGFIGKAPVFMHLAFGTKVRGALTYPAQGLGVGLEGTLKAGRLSVKVSRNESKIGGQFNAVVSAPYASVSGKWSDAKLRRTENFTLDRIATINRRTNVEEGVYAFSATYPQFESRAFAAASALNDTITRFVADVLTLDLPDEESRAMIADGSMQPFEGELSFSFACCNSSVISMLTSEHIYTGGAHGNTAYLMRTVDISDGKVRNLRLGDFFKPGSEWRQAVSTACMIDLRRQKAQWVLDGEMKDAYDYFEFFTVSGTGIEIVFPPYAAGPYSDGTYSVTIPWNKLETLIDPAGPARKVMDVK